MSNYQGWILLFDPLMPSTLLLSVMKQFIVLISHRKFMSKSEPTHKWWSHLSYIPKSRVGILSYLHYTPWLYYTWNADINWPFDKVNHIGTDRHTWRFSEVAVHCFRLAMRMVLFSDVKRSSLKFTGSEKLVGYEPSWNFFFTLQDNTSG